MSESSVQPGQKRKLPDAVGPSWSVRDKLILASTVLHQPGDVGPNWSSIARHVKTVATTTAHPGQPDTSTITGSSGGDTETALYVDPSVQFSGRSCAQQYSHLLDAIDQTSSRRHRLPSHLADEDAPLTPPQQTTEVGQPAPAKLVHMLTTQRIDELLLEIQSVKVEHKRLLGLLNKVKAYDTSSPNTEAALVDIKKELESPQKRVLTPAVYNSPQKSVTNSPPNKQSSVASVTPVTPLKTVKKEPSSGTSSPNVRKSSDQQIDAKITSRQAGSPAATAVRSVSVTSSMSDAPSGVNFRRVALQLLCWCEAHRHGKIFRDPVTDAIAPDYGKLIKQPKSIIEIKRRVEQQRTGPDAPRATAAKMWLRMKNDLLGMLANAVMYNSIGHPVHTAALELYDDLRPLLQQHDDQFVAVLVAPSFGGQSSAADSEIKSALHVDTQRAVTDRKARRRTVTGH